MTELVLSLRSDVSHSYLQDLGVTVVHAVLVVSIHDSRLGLLQDLEIRARLCGLVFIRGHDYRSLAVHLRQIWLRLTEIC